MAVAERIEALTGSEAGRAYAEDVVAGRILASWQVIKQCQQHLDWLEKSETDPSFPYTFDEFDADRRCSIFPRVFRLPDRSPFELLDWQSFTTAYIFGWKYKTADQIEDLEAFFASNDNFPADEFLDELAGTRVVRTAYISVARKNGKTTFVEGIGIILAWWDQEVAAEVYNTATSREQAAYGWGFAKAMVLDSPSLRRRVTVGARALTQKNTSRPSLFRPLAADHKKLDALNAHCSLVDEYHEHPTDKVKSKVKTSMVARSQPLEIITTTAGDSTSSPCYKHQQDCERILKGIKESPETFSFIAQLEMKEDWTDAGLWSKANPSLGHTVKISTLRKECQEALEDVSKQNTFRRMHCNQWVRQAVRSIDMVLWKKCEKRFEFDQIFENREVWVGMDLAVEKDLSAVAYLGPPKEDDPFFRLWVDVFCPSVDIEVRSRRDGQPYDQWAQSGEILLAGEKRTDFDVVKDLILERSKVCAIRSIGYDARFAAQIVNRLEDAGFELEKVAQGFNLSTAHKWLKAILRSNELRHPGNRVVTWSADNLSERENPQGEIMPDKKKSSERIDPMSAIVTAIHVWLPSQEERRSVYETRGIRVV